MGWQIDRQNDRCIDGDGEKERKYTKERIKETRHNSNGRKK